MLFSMVYTRSTVVRVPELTNAVIAGLVASCAPAAVMPLSVSPLVGPGDRTGQGKKCKKLKKKKKNRRSKEASQCQCVNAWDPCCTLSFRICGVQDSLLQFSRWALRLGCLVRINHCKIEENYTLRISASLIFIRAFSWSCIEHCGFGTVKLSPT